jgi:hypothetical protein
VCPLPSRPEPPDRRRGHQGDVVNDDAAVIGVPAKPWSAPCRIRPGLRSRRLDGRLVSCFIFRQGQVSRNASMTIGGNGSPDPAGCWVIQDSYSGVNTIGDMLWWARPEGFGHIVEGFDFTVTNTANIIGLTAILHHKICRATVWPLLCVHWRRNRKEANACCDRTNRFHRRHSGWNRHSGLFTALQDRPRSNSCSGRSRS